MDRRVEKTRRAIQSAYLALRRQQPDGALTVAAVAELADIGRGTFYLHYPDLAALEAAIIDELAATITAQLTAPQAQPIGGSYRNWLSAVLAMLASHRELLQLARASGRLDRLTVPSRAALITLLTARAPGELDPLAVRYCAAGLVGLVTDWFSGALDCPEPMLVTMMDQQIRALLA